MTGEQGKRFLIVVFDALRPKFVISKPMLDLYPFAATPRARLVDKNRFREHPLPVFHG